MKTLLLFAYYVVFVLDTHPECMRRAFQRRWVYDTAREVAATQADLQEGMRMMEIPAHESGYDPSAVGKRGERGRWQVLGGNDFSANAALARMRLGMVSFVGCRRAEDHVVLPNGVKTTCQQMIDNRVGPADRYLVEHPPPPAEPMGALAGGP